MEAFELFFGLCRYYSSLGLDDETSWNSWTQRSLSYFDQLGRMLGYKVVTEDTLIDEKNWKCPPELHKKRIDLTWIYPDRYVYALALEHEGSHSWKKITLGIKKLSVFACLRVLMIYNENIDRIQTQIETELSKTGVEAGSFLFINMPENFMDVPPITKLEARLVDERGKLVADGTAEARKEKITGLRFFSNPRWNQKT
jgi:hypothetical protein